MRPDLTTCAPCDGRWYHLIPRARGGGGGPLVGRGNEVGGFCDFFLPLAHSRHVHRICSVVATAWLRGGGVQPFNPLFDCDHVSPVDLWETPALNTVWVP